MSEKCTQVPLCQTRECRPELDEFITVFLEHEWLLSLITFMMARQKVTASLGPTNDRLHTLKTSSFLSAAERDIVQGLQICYLCGHKVYSIFAYDDPCVILFLKNMERVSNRTSEMTLLFWMTQLVFSACTNRCMMHLWSSFLDCCEGNVHVGTCWIRHGQSMFGNAIDACYQSCTKRGNGTLAARRENLISSINALCVMDVSNLNGAYAALTGGQANGVSVMLRLLTSCGLKWVGKFKAHFTVAMLRQRYPTIKVDLYLGPRVHLSQCNSGMRKLFGRFHGSLPHTDVLGVFLRFFDLVKDILPQQLGDKLAPWDLQHSICEWMKFLDFTADKDLSGVTEQVPDNFVIAIDG